MLRSTASKVIWVGRATVFLVGLSVILALVFGVATMAFAANGNNFVLGVLTNSATAITKLTGNVAGGPALQVANFKTEAGSKALQLNVAANKPPLAVNATAGKATHLNADQLDGVDSAALIRWASIYERTLNTNGGAGPDETATAALECDQADTILSGGFTNMDNGTHLIGSWTGQGTGGSHFVQWRNNATVDTIVIIVKCADTTP